MRYPHAAPLKRVSASHLSASAPAGAGVDGTESKLLIDRRSGGNVEVDIVIDASVGGAHVVVGIECTAGKRPATVEWVREMAGKHADLPVDKTVLVSESGFTAAARLKAEQLGMDALDLGAAEQQDWEGWLLNLDSLRHALFSLTAERVGVGISGAVIAEEAIRPDAATVQEPPPAVPRRLDDFGKGLLGDSRVFLAITRQWLDLASDARPSSFTFDLKWDAPAGTSFRTASGDDYPLTTIVLKVRADVRDEALAARAARYRGQNVVFGQLRDVPTKEGRADVLYTLFGEGESYTRGAALISIAGSGNTKIVPLTVPAKSKDESGKT